MTGLAEKQTPAALHALGDSWPFPDVPAETSSQVGSELQDLMTIRLTPRASRLTPHVAIRKWNDFGRVSCSKPTRDNVQPRPESLTPVQASAGSR